MHKQTHTELRQHLFDLNLFSAEHTADNSTEDVVQVANLYLQQFAKFYVYLKVASQGMEVRERITRMNKLHPNFVQFCKVRKTREMDGYMDNRYVI